MIKVRVCQYVFYDAITAITNLIQKNIFPFYCLDYVTQQNAVFEGRHIKPSPHHFIARKAA